MQPRYSQAELQSARNALEDVSRSRGIPFAPGPTLVFQSGLHSQGGVAAAPAGDGRLMGSRLGAAGAGETPGVSGMSAHCLAKYTLRMGRVGASPTPGPDSLRCCSACDMSQPQGDMAGVHGAYMSML